MLISSIRLLLVLIFCCYLPAFVMFHDHSRRASLALFWVYVNVGLGSLGVFVILAKAAGVDMKASIIPGGLVSLYALIRYGKRCLPQVQIPKIDVHLLIAIIISVIYFLHVLIPGILMGGGSYPPVFFGTDSPYDLGHIHGLIQSASWPLLSLSSLGVPIGYTYGMHSVCAVIAQLTGVTPHASAFLIYIPITTLGILSVVWLLTQVNGTDRHLLWLGLLLLLYHSSYPLYRIYGIFHADLLTIPQKLLKILKIFIDVQMFSGGYPGLKAPIGLFLSLVVFYCLQDIVVPSRQRLAAFVIGILMAFKAPFFVPVGMGFGLWILWEIYRTHKITLLFAPIGALLIGILLQNISALTTNISLIITPWQFFMDKSRLFNFVSSKLIYALPLSIGLKYKISFTEKKTLYYLFFIMPPLVLANIFGFVRTADRTPFKNGLWEMVGPVSLYFIVFVFAILRTNWTALTRQARTIVTIIVVVLTIIPLGHELLYTLVPLVAPEDGHEYLDNKPLAEALATIPVDGSIIVTNDFRYPAKNYKEDLRQPQFPALFGHQAYAVNFRNERYPDMKQRFDVQQRFRKPEWDPELELLAQRLGWTHLVIHRASPHSEKIPLPLIFENEEYQVYLFTRSLSLYQ